MPLIDKVFSQIGTACDEWFGFLFLSGPPNPPFSPGATFKDEWGQFFRVLSTSGLLTAVVLGVQRLSQKAPAPIVRSECRGENNRLFCAIRIIVCIVGEVIPNSHKFTAGFFCLSLATIPFLPLFVVLRWLGPWLKALVVVIVFYVLLIYIVYWLVKTIAVTSQCGLVRTMLSVLSFATILVWALFWF